jgi:alpha/beta superfamily hydrolase
VAIAELLMERDSCAVLRFNYRGVGKSQGRYDEGRGETMDARAGLRFLRQLAPHASLSVCGHSFGARVALRAATADAGVDRLALLAPVGRGSVRAFAGDAAIFVGERDPHCTIERAHSLAEALGAELHVVEQADHFFLDARSSVAQMVARHIAPEAA